MNYDGDISPVQSYDKTNGTTNMIDSGVIADSTTKPTFTYLDYRHSSIEEPRLNDAIQNHEHTNYGTKSGLEALRIDTAQPSAVPVSAEKLFRPTIRPITPEGATPASPRLVVEYSPSGSPQARPRTGYRSRGRTSFTTTAIPSNTVSPVAQDGSFLGIQTSIPTGDMEDPFGAENVQVSKTGTVYINGRQARDLTTQQEPDGEQERGLDENIQVIQRQAPDEDVDEQFSHQSELDQALNDLSKYEEAEPINSEDQQPAIVESLKDDVQRPLIQEHGQELKSEKQATPVRETFGNGRALQQPERAPEQDRVQQVQESQETKISTKHVDRHAYTGPSATNISSFNKVDGSVFGADQRSPSLRVRSLYDMGSMYAGAERPGSALSSNLNESLDGLPHGELTPKPSKMGNGLLASPRSTSAMSTRTSRDPGEAAGGVEDWTNVLSTDVDRYGFIRDRSLRSKHSSLTIASSSGTPDQSRMQRPYTPLPAINETPTRAPQSQNRTEASRSSPGAFAQSGTTLSKPPPSTRNHRSRISAFDFLRSPRTRQKNLLADAKTMITVPINSSTTLASLDSLDFSDPNRSKLEASRVAKWEKMARPGRSLDLHTGGLGAGKVYTFNTSDPRLISRTWKGIPDRWRATAWHSFLSASAARHSPTGRPSPTDNDLIARFHALQDVDCPDDVQIDIDVPRTIGQHVMFRKRYRGGQRLLFRVLHALALHFPEIGYVQGMAALVATLVCYFEEERAFVMAVRMWTLRGVAWLYREGFGGLMSALDDFEKGWMGVGDGGAIRKKLDNLGVGPSIWGAKWYLTLFNYSLPFQAQLRVWDVFMLLGDPPSLSIPDQGSGPGQSKSTPDMRQKAAQQSGGAATARKPNLDILHAVTAALLLGLRDKLLSAEFEAAMECLTAAVPVLGDAAEDALMRVARGVLGEAERAAGVRGR